MPRIDPRPLHETWPPGVLRLPRPNIGRPMIAAPVVEGVASAGLRRETRRPPRPGQRLQTPSPVEPPKWPGRSSGVSRIKLHSLGLGPTSPIPGQPAARPDYCVNRWTRKEALIRDSSRTTPLETTLPLGNHASPVGQVSRPRFPGQLAAPNHCRVASGPSGAAAKYSSSRCS